jgi:hypothetical protein
MIEFSVAYHENISHVFETDYDWSQAMPRKAKNGVNESNLSRGQVRKLTALRKSLGDEIANRAFTEWLSANGNGGATAADKNARAISDALQPLIETGKLSVPRGGYLVRRGRGRVIIERLE